MKSLFASLFIALTFMVAQANASVNPPKDSNGNTLPTIDWVGALPCNIDISTGTNAVQCGDDGRNVVYGVITSSLAITNYVVLRDSGTANTTSAVSATVFAENEGADEDGTLLFRFPVPIRFSNGISANAASAPTGAGRFTILYRPLNATE